MAAFAIGNDQLPPATTGLAVTFDGAAQTWNATAPQPLTWGSVAPSMAYTKNVTVTNNLNQSVTLILYTTEPAGCTQTWPRNMTELAANKTTSADLTLNTASTITAGDFTWLLAASNSTQPAATPTPTSTAQPTTKLNCTINSEVGAEQIKVTNVNAGGSIILTPPVLPYTLSFTVNDTLKFEVTPLPDYTFNAWTFTGIDLFPQDAPTYTFTANASFTITANFLLNSTGAP